MAATDGQPPEFRDLREPTTGHLLARYDPAGRVLEVKRKHGEGPVRFSLDELEGELIDRREIG